MVPSVSQKKNNYGSIGHDIEKVVFERSVLTLYFFQGLLDILAKRGYY